MKRSKEDIAWASGLFEGEGCLAHTLGRRGKAQVVAALGMTDRDVVERFARIIGFGHFSGPRHFSGEHRKHWKPMYEWRTGEAEAIIELINLFLPHFGERRCAKAEEVLEVALTIRPHNAKTTHCPRGHAFTPDNTLTEPISHARVDGTIGNYTARRCKTCRYSQLRAARQRRAAIAA